MKILVVDDHQLFVDGLERILLPAFTSLSVTKAYKADDALQLLDEQQDFDLILLDLGLPGTNGLDLLRTIMARKLWIPVVVLSALDEIRVIKQLIRSGAMGFVPKSYNSHEVINALKLVLSGETYLPEDLQERLSGFHDQSGNTTQAAIDRSGLTRRQLDVLSLLGRGYSNKEIASKLYLTNNTVKSHIKSLFRSLGVSNRLACIRSAEELGLLNPPPD